ncbi:MAG: hypothetical protein QOE65_933 [Solirubrobacteraceae bacterium]|nr:hypothetical protein [Solirubrobacteraceae bacterium]
MEEPDEVEWLPPQAAGATTPPHFRPPTVDPSWPPPAVPGAQPPAAGPGGARSGTDVPSLIAGVAGLVLFVFPAGFGLVFLFNLPASILAWSMGRNAGPRGRTGKVLGIVGTVLGVLAIVAWAAAIALSDELRHDLRRAVEQGRR